MRSSTASSVACCANRALRVRVCNFRDFKKTLTEEYLDESREARARGARVGAMGAWRGCPVRAAACDFRLITPGTHSQDEPRCQVLPARKDTGTRAQCVFLALRCAQLTVASV